MAERKEPDDVVGSLGKKNAAYQALKTGDLEKAKNLFEELAKEYPWVASFKFNLALTYFKLGQFQTALESVDAGLAIEPGDERARAMREAIATKTEMTKRETTALEDRIKPVALERNLEDEKMTAAFLDSQFTEHVIVLPSGETEPDASPTGPPGYSYSRLMNFVVFESQRRRTELRSGNENSTEEDPHAARLSWYSPASDSDRASDAAPYGIAFSPRPKITAEYVDDLMTRIDMLPKTEEAVFMDTLKSRYSYDIRYIKEAINELHRSQHYQEAIRACEKFLTHFPDDLEVLFEMGNFFLERGNIVQSETMFKRIIEMYYENAYAWHNLARIYEIRGLWQYEAFCLQQAKNFGYPVDEIRLARFLIRGVPVDPFTDNVHWE
ncbi:MAG: tetratricopeptide repeat protein [Candidatus Lokiarchaeota archaeon]|nr:tetratricopeptide repeat protein [Candidatus Lokiarchaeota archaeon]